MHRQLLKSVLAAAIALAAAGSAAPCFASGADPATVLTPAPQVRPEQPALAGYLDGKLGVLWPSYDRAFLLIAYRVVHGLEPLSKADAERLSNPDSPAAPYSDPLAEAQKSWLAARGQHQPAAPGYELVSGWRAMTEYSYSANCQADAFLTAARTLQARAGAHAGDTTALQHWIAAQDSVFSHCERSKEGLPMPALPADAPAWLQQDQAYQQAAALLYQEKLDEAGTAFGAIAADADSPWREWALYLQVRSWWRQNFRDPAAYRDFVTATPQWQEHAQLRRLKQAAAAKNTEVAAAAQQLYDALTTRFAPRATVDRLWQEAAAKQPPADLQHWVDNLRFTWAVAGSADLAEDWLYATRSLQRGYGDAESDAAAGRLRTQWTTHKDLLALASLLMAATPQSSDSQALVEASRAVKPQHPLYLHFAWQRARIAVTAGHADAARKELDAVATALQNQSLGTRQHFDQLAMLAAPDLATLGKHLIRVPVAEESTEYGLGIALVPDNAARQLDQDTQQWLADQLSGKDLLQLAGSADLPDQAQQQLAGEAWLQGVFLPDQALELAAARMLAELRQQPALIEAIQTGDLAETRFLTAQWLLNATPQQRLASTYGWPRRGFPAALQPRLDSASHWQTPPAFYDEAARQLRRDSAATLSKANETTWLGQQILAWISAHPEQTDAPRLLREVVYASRYIMKDTPTSRRAFQLLHKLYPDSSEAKDTKYFY